MFVPCVELCYQRYGEQYTKECDEKCDYAKAIKELNELKEYLKLLKEKYEL